MGWDFEIPQTSNNELADIEVGSLYKLKQWNKGKFIQRSGRSVGYGGSWMSPDLPDSIVIPLKRLTYNMNTGDTELTVLVNNEITVLPGWMIGQNGGLLEKLN